MSNNNIGQLLNLALKNYSIHRLDAELLLAGVTNLSRVKIKISHDQILDDLTIKKFLDLVRKRAQGIPVAYLVGYKDFWTFSLIINQNVLIPRIDTEVLVETALEYLPQDSSATILDLGTGSGAIALALALERPNSSVVGVDFNPEAVKLAQLNAGRLHVDNVRFFESNWFSNVSDKFQMIVANPPYIADNSSALEPDVAKHEPASALYAGQDGLDALREILKNLMAYLELGGYFIVEHGYDQSPEVRKLLQHAGLINVLTVNDLAGHPRVSLGIKNDGKSSDVLAL